MSARQPTPNQPPNPPVPGLKNRLGKQFANLLFWLLLFLIVASPLVLQFLLIQKAGYWLLPLAMTLFLIAGVAVVALIFCFLWTQKSDQTSDPEELTASVLFLPHVFRISGIVLITALFIFMTWILLLANPFVHVSPSPFNLDNQLENLESTRLNDGRDSSSKTNGEPLGELISVCSFVVQDTQKGKAKSNSADATIVPKYTDGIELPSEFSTESVVERNGGTETQEPNKSTLQEIHNRELIGDTKLKNGSGNQKKNEKESGNDSPPGKDKAEKPKLVRIFTEDEAKVWSYGIFSTCVFLAFCFSAYVIQQCVSEP